MKFFDRIMSFFGLEKVMGASRVVFRRPSRHLPKPQNTNPISDKPIEYILNDPTTPNLVLSVPVPARLAKPAFSVDSYRGGGFPPGSVESQAANCFVTITKTIEFLNKYTDKPLEKWASTSSIRVLPRAGKDLNAYYDRVNLKFFYMTNDKFGTIFTCDSADVVSHELGHAILDAYRPDMWSAAFLEVAAFHEAFGDFVAMMKLLSHDEICNHILSQTSGNLKQRNVVTNMAEQLGKAIFALTPGSGRDPNCLRCAINNFKYVNPGTLPEDGPDNVLSAECHSFARILVGAFYDILVMLFLDGRSQGLTDLESLHQARDVLLRYMMKAIQHAPLNVNFYESISRTILWADVTLNNRKYHDRIQSIFFERNLLTPQVKMLSAPSCDNENGIVEIQSTKVLKLSDHLIRAQSESDNPLYDVDIEIPQNQAHLYDNDKNLFDSILVSDDESLSGAQDMISYLHKTNSVSDDPMTAFEVKDGRLVRTHFI